MLKVPKTWNQQRNQLNGRAHSVCEEHPVCYLSSCDFRAVALNHSFGSNCSSLVLLLVLFEYCVQFWDLHFKGHAQTEKGFG